METVKIDEPRLDESFSFLFVFRKGDDGRWSRRRCSRGCRRGRVGGCLIHRRAQGRALFYEDALRQGRSVIIGLSERDDQIEAGKSALNRAAAETLDSAREK